MRCWRVDLRVDLRMEIVFRLQIPLLFLLITLLILQPVTPQMAGGLGACRCEKIKPPPTPTLLVKYADNVLEYEDCPANLIRFIFPNGNFCGKKSEDWVRYLICYLDKGTATHDCLSILSSKPHQDCIKGSEKRLLPNPPTSPPPTSHPPTSPPPTHPPPTSTPPTSPPPTSPPPTSPPPTSPPANADPQAQNPTDQPWTSTVQLQEDTQTQRALGNTSGDQQARDSPNLNSEVGNKMKNMTVAVISLLLVTLGLVATVTVLICRRKRRGGKSPSLPLITQCTASNPRYQLAPETDHT